MGGVLSGIRVIEWTMWITAGAGAMLADLGADVIKIEQPGRGDGLRGQTHMYGSAMDLPGGQHIGLETANRGKRSITLDLATEKGRNIFFGMIEKADVFFTNFRLGMIDKLGIDYETLSARNPKLVYAHIASFGSRGPWANKRGYDPLAQARSGLMYAMGEKDDGDAPVQVSGAICDQMAATMAAYGMLAALLERERTGKGQKVETSLYGSMLHQQAMGINVTSMRGKPYGRHARKRQRNPLVNHYRCADGKWLVFSEVQSDRFWHSFCEALGLLDIEHDPKFATALEGRRNNNIELIEILDRTFATKTQKEWLDIFDRLNVSFAYCPVQNFHEVLEDEQALANDYIIDFDHPTAGKTRMTGYPVKFSRTPCSIERAAPELGQHTEEILLEFGYDWDEIIPLKEEGII